MTTSFSLPTSKRPKILVPRISELIDFARECARFAEDRLFRRDRTAVG
jgi:hypothetical protein